MIKKINEKRVTTRRNIRLELCKVPTACFSNNIFLLNLISVAQKC